MFLNGFLSAFLASLLFASNIVCARILSADFSYYFLSMVRLVLSAGSLFFLINFKDFVKPNLKDYFLYSLLAISLIFINVTFFSSLKYQVATNYAVITAIVPLATALFSAFIFSIKLRRRFILALILAFIGIYVIIAQGELDYSLLTFNKGDLIALVNVACWVVYNIVVKFLSRKYSPIFINFYSAFLASIFFVPFAIPELSLNLFKSLTLSQILNILYLSTAGTAAAFCIYSDAIKRIGPGKSSFIAFGLAPIWVTLISFFYLYEPLTIWHIVGGVIVIVAMGLGLLK